MRASWGLRAVVLGVLAWCMLVEAACGDICVGQSTCTPTCYCPFLSTTFSVSCTSCGPNKQSGPSQGQCICNPGYYATSGALQPACAVCANGTFAIAAGNVNACPSCPAGQTSYSPFTSCTDCLAGFYGPGGSPCLPCAPGNGTSTNGRSACDICGNGFYSTGGTPCQQCGANSTTLAPGAQKASDCLCVPGYARYSASCQQCLRGSYKGDYSNNNSCSSACGLGRSGPRGAVDVSACHDCPADNYQDQLIGPCIDCPANSSTFGATGVTSLSGCVCPPGRGGASCALCVVGSYQPLQSLNACTACGAGKSTLDVGSDAASDCFSCAVGSYNPLPAGACWPCAGNRTTTGNGTTSISGCMCTPGHGGADCSVCPLGSYKGGVNNNTCVGCGPGYTTNHTGALGVGECIKCPRGFYQNASIGVCQPCPTNRTTAAPGASACTCDVGRGGAGCALCQVGTYKNTYDNNNCTMCGGGTSTCPNGDSYCITGALNCTTCGYAFYKPGNQILPCTPCDSTRNTTSPGSFQAGTCLCRPGFTDRHGAANAPCLQCPIGTYKFNLSNDACLSCPAGFNTTVRQATNVSQCDSCSANHWGAQCQLCNCTSGSCIQEITTTDMCTCSNTSGLYGSQCDKCSVQWWGAGCNHTCSCVNGMCLNGFTGNGTCSAGSCAPGWDGVNCDVCLPGYSGINCDVCSPGYEPNLNYFACDACQPGYAKDSYGDARCAMCGAGSFAAGLNNSVCSPCAVGFYTGGEGSSGCTGCVTSGYYAPHDAGLGALFCVPCDVGTFQNTTLQDYCYDCPPGYYGDQQAATSCSPCLAGSAQGSYHQTSCGICDAGSYSGPAASGCTQCAAGYAATSANSTGCAICGPGTISAGLGGTQCQSCGAGEYQAGSGFDHCDICTYGEYQTGPAATSCIACNMAGGYTTNANHSGAASDCVPCPLGQYKGAGVGECLWCPYGWLSNGQTTQQEASTQLTQCGCNPGFGTTTDSVACTVCADGSYKTDFNTGTCTVCPGGTYWRTTVVPCVICPLGGVCVGGSTPPHPGAGWWGDPSQPPPVAYSQCVPKEVCQDTGACIPGHTGERCAECLNGWYKSADTKLCYTCPPAVPLIIVALVVACAILCIVLVRLALKNAYIFACASVGFNFLQAIAVLPSFNVKWPPLVLKAFDIVTILNLDLHIFQPECMVKDGSKAYFYVYGLKLGAPIFFGAMVALYYAFLYAYYLWRKNRDFMKDGCLAKVFPYLSEKEIIRYRHACVNAYLSILIFTYLMLASTSLEIYSCTQGDDGRFTMDREPYVYCYEPLWYYLLVASIFGITIYVIGLPVVIAVILIRRRRNLHKEKNIVRLGLLYLRYRPTVYFWELCILLRKFGILSGKIIFASDPLPQILMALGSLVIAVVAQFFIRPFRAARVNRLEIMHLSCAAFVIVLGALFYEFGEKLDGSTRDSLAVLIIFVIAINIFAIMIAVFFELQHNRKLSKHGVTGRFASDRMDVDETFFHWGVRLVRHEQEQYDAAKHAATAFDELDEHSTIITIELTSERPLDMRVQMASNDLVPFPEREGGNPCQRAADYLRSLSMTSLEEDPLDQYVTSTTDGKKHTITMAARRSGRYAATIFAKPIDGVFHARKPPSDCYRCYLRRCDANYDKKLRQTTDVQRFTAVGANLILHTWLSVYGDWTADEDGLLDYDVPHGYTRKSGSSMRLIGSVSSHPDDGDRASRRVSLGRTAQRTQSVANPSFDYAYDDSHGSDAQLFNRNDRE